MQMWIGLKSCSISLSKRMNFTKDLSSSLCNTILLVLSQCQIWSHFVWYKQSSIPLSFISRCQHRRSDCTSIWQDNHTWVSLNNSLTLSDHISAVCRSAHFHIRALRHIRGALTEWHGDNAVAASLVQLQSRFDYANSLVHGSTNIKRLQAVRNLLLMQC